MLLTKCPSQNNNLRRGKKHEWHSTGSIIVKQQKHIKSSLEQIWKKRQREISAVNFPEKNFSNLLFTSVTISRPIRKDKTQTTSSSILRRWPMRKKDGYRSDMDVTKLSRHTNWVKKNKRFLLSDFTFFFLYFNSFSYPLWVIDRGYYLSTTES